MFDLLVPEGLLKPENLQDMVLVVPYSYDKTHGPKANWGGEGLFDFTAMS